MDDARLVGVIEGMADMPNYGGYLSRFEQGLFSAELTEFLSLDKFHGDVKVSTFFNHIIYGDNARM